MARQHESILRKSTSTIPLQAPDSRDTALGTCVPVRSHISVEARTRWINTRSRPKVVEKRSAAEIDNRCLEFADRLIEAIDRRIAAGGKVDLKRSDFPRSAA